MTKPVWIKWFPSDAISGMEMLTMSEELAYRRILDLIYATADAVPDNDKAMCRYTKIGSRWPAVKASLIEKGKIEVVDGRITNHKCREILEKNERFFAQKSEAGTASANRRKSLKEKDCGATDDEISLQQARIQKLEDKSLVSTSPPSTESESYTTPLPPAGAVGGGEADLFSPDFVAPDGDYTTPVVTANVTHLHEHRAAKAAKKHFTEADFQAVVSEWNAMAAKAKLTTVKCLNNARRDHLKGRITEAGGVDAMLEVIRGIPNAPFLIGRNDKGWKASFDFILQPSSFAKLVDGNYHAIKAKSATGGGYFDAQLGWREG